MAYENVGSGWNLVPVTQAATDVTINLNGERRGGVTFILDLLGASGTPSITMQPVGVTANQSGTSTYNNGATVSSQGDSALRIGICGRSDAARLRGTASIPWTQTGVYRELIAVTHTGTGTGIASEQQFSVTDTWKDSTTPISAVTFHSSVASGIDVGSKIWWRYT